MAVSHVMALEVPRCMRGPAPCELSLVLYELDRSSWIQIFRICADRGRKLLLHRGVPTRPAGILATGKSPRLERVDSPVFAVTQTGIDRGMSINDTFAHVLEFPILGLGGFFRGAAELPPQAFKLMDLTD